MPNFPLGRRPADPDRLARAVDATPFLRAALPEHPAMMKPQPGPFPIDRNDQAGTCVPASGHHGHIACDEYATLPAPSYADAQLLADYQTQNPDFRDWGDSGTWRDQGMIMQTFNEYLVSEKRIVAFGRLDPDPEVIRAAANVMGSVSIGASLTVAQADQFDAGQPWDYVAGAAPWGGHAIAANGYAPGQVGIETWATLTALTDRFVTQQVDEVWLLLWPEQLIHPPAGFDLDGFFGRVVDVTGGRVNPYDYVPPGPPEPPPTVDPLAIFPWSTMDSWAGSFWARLFSGSAVQAYKDWKAAVGR